MEQELLPGALKAASASVEAALADLRELALLEQAHSGDGTVLVDQHDTAAYAARADRDVRRRAVDVIAAGGICPTRKATFTAPPSFWRHMQPL